MATTVGDTANGATAPLYPMEYLEWDRPNENGRLSPFTVKEIREIAAKHKMSDLTKSGTKENNKEALQAILQGDATKRWNPRINKFEPITAFAAMQLQQRASASAQRDDMRSRTLRRNHTDESQLSFVSGREGSASRSPRTEPPKVDPFFKQERTDSPRGQHQMEVSQAHETPVPVDDETQDPAEDMKCDDDNEEEKGRDKSSITQHAQPQGCDKTVETSDAQPIDRDKVHITMHATDSTKSNTALSSPPDSTTGGQVVPDHEACTQPQVAPAATQPTTALSSLPDLTMGGQAVEGDGRSALVEHHTAPVFAQPPTALPSPPDSTMGGQVVEGQAAPATPNPETRPIVSHQNILEQPTVKPVALSPAPSNDTVVSTASGFGVNTVQTAQDGQKNTTKLQSQETKGVAANNLDDEEMNEPRGVKTTLSTVACFDLDYEVQEIEESRAIQEEANERQRSKFARREEPGAGSASSSGLHPPPGLTPQQAQTAPLQTHTGGTPRDPPLPVNDLDAKIARMAEKMELLLVNQQESRQMQLTQDHAKNMFHDLKADIWQKVQDQVEPIKTKQAELDKRVTVLEGKEEKPDHATTQLIRITDKHDPANTQVTVMWQIAQQSLDQKMQAIRELIQELNYEAVDVQHFNKSERSGGGHAGTRITFTSNNVRETFLKSALNHPRVRDPNNPLSKYKWGRARTDVESLRISDWKDAERQLEKHPHTTKGKLKLEMLFKNKEDPKDKTRRIKVGGELAYSQSQGQIAGTYHGPFADLQKK